jgi:membrane fusion protein (multidrug efflux system)
VIKKIALLCKSCLSFWKGLIFSSNRRGYIRRNSEELKKQTFVLIALYGCCFVIYQSLKPAVKGACGMILRTDNDMIAGFGNRLVGIEAKRVVTGTTRNEVRSIGVLRAKSEVMLKAEIDGKIESVHFVEGADVEEGQDLRRFEDAYYRSEANKYRSEYIARRSEYERVRKLYDQKAGSQKTLDEALAHMEEAKAQLDGALFQLSKTVIKAPFSGTVGILKEGATSGNFVQRHTELTTIVDNSTMKVEFRVPVKYVDSIAVNQSVEITVDAYKGKVFAGIVDAIDSIVDHRSHSILVRAVIPNRGELKHGMFANVKLITGEKSDVVLVEEGAIDREGAIEFVWIVDEKGRAYRKRVMTGAKDASGVEILAGLKEGEIVVTTGQLKLTDGTKVKILNRTEVEGSADGAVGDAGAPSGGPVEGAGASHEEKTDGAGDVSHVVEAERVDPDKADGGEGGKSEESTTGE